MSQAQDPAAYIYEGVWRNWDKYGSRSLTLTLCPTKAVILTNALALFVAMSGGQLWTIIRFSLHQFRSTYQSRKDIIHNQQQVVLRNATTDIATARLMLYLAWMSRTQSGRIVSSCIIILLLAIFNATFFMVAGTFSNTLVNAGSTVLTISPHCGSWNETYVAITGGSVNPTDDETFALSIEYIANKEQDVQLSVEYAQACYMSPDSWYWASTCGTYPNSRLNWTTTLNNSCPFDSAVCDENSKTIVFDTGVIDSHTDLGINAQLQDRLGYRRVTTCTVLDNKNYTTDWQVDAAGSEQVKTAYAFYGPSLYKGTNFTYSYSNFADFYTNYSATTTSPYQLAYQVAYGVVSNVNFPDRSTFEPIPELVQSSADVVVFLLGFTGQYTHPIDDPWFSAHTVFHRDSHLPLVQTTYARDKPISAMGCTEQHQICSPTKGCTPLLGFTQVQQGINTDLQLTPKQNVTLDRLLWSISTSNLDVIVDRIAVTSAPLLAINATATESTTLSLPLPRNQWQHELEYWHSIAMAELQRSILDWSTGQVAARTEYLLPPQTDFEKWICENQTIQSTTFQSFSVLALAFIISFGALIIVMSLTIENCARYLQRRWGRGGYGRDMWKDHDMLGLQLWRMNFEIYRRWQYTSAPHTPVPPFLGGGPRYTVGGPRYRCGGPYYSGGGIQGPHLMPTQIAPQDWGSMQDSKALMSQPSLGGIDMGLQPDRRISAARSPPPSAFTAEFAFDFRTPVEPIPSSKGQYAVEYWGEKPLPEVPLDEKKEFIIDRGVDISMSTATTMQPAKQGSEVVPSPPQPAVVNASGPGRWAYYSAHKRRYGPKSTVHDGSNNESTISSDDPAGEFQKQIPENWI